MTTVIISGHLTRGIELRYTPANKAVAKTGIASNKSYKNDNGEKVTKVTFIDIVAFGKAAELMNQYLTKGSHVLIKGELDYESWTDKDGNKRSKNLVVIERIEFLDKREGDDIPELPDPDEGEEY